MILNLLLSIILTLGFAQTEGNKPIDVVFDLDWTLFYKINEKSQLNSNENIIEFQGERYRLTDHAVQVIERMLAIPGLRISFFSGGQQARNEHLLSVVKLSDGRSLGEIAHRTLHYRHLSRTNAPDSSPFVDRYKKDFFIWSIDSIPSRTILIDDLVKFARKPLFAIDSLGHFEFTSKYNPDMKSEPYFAENYFDWLIERSKARWWYELLKEANLRQADNIVKVIEQQIQNGPHFRCRSIYLF